MAETSIRPARGPSLRLRLFVLLVAGGGLAGGVWTLGLGAGEFAAGAGVDCAAGAGFDGAASAGGALGLGGFGVGAGLGAFAGAFVSAAKAEKAARLADKTAAPKIVIIANP